MTAKCDSHPQGGDASAAPFMTSAVPEGHSPETHVTPSGMAEQVREAAAKVAEQFPLRTDYTKHDTMNGIAAAIRAMPLPKSSDKTTLADDGLREALKDARLFVDLVHIHWKNMGDQEQADEATDCLKNIDAALQQGGSGDAVRELLREAGEQLREIHDYNGGAETAMCDEYVVVRTQDMMARIDAALSASSGDDTVGVAK
jgi:hypothetical protein